MTEKKCRDLELLLKREFGDDFSVLDCKFESLVPLGENFGSELMRLTARIKHRENSEPEVFNFVWKTVTSASYSVDWDWLFKREIFMYTDIVPLYTRMELDSGVDKKDTIDSLVPKLYGYRHEDDAVIIMENVQERGYYTIGKNKGMDLEHTLLAARALAKFHALGMAARKNRPVDFEKIKLVAEKPGFDPHGQDDLCQKISSIIRTDPRFSKYSHTVDDLVSKYEGNFNLEMVSGTPWTTICHNDFWTNNVMFKDEEVKFIDFQTYCLANCTVDLPYFLCISLDDPGKLDEVLDAYHEALISTLRKMNVDVGEYSRREFEERLRMDAPYEFFHCAIAWVYFTADCDTAANNESLVTSILNCEAVNDSFYEKLLGLLELYEAKNWLH